jgi:hypothetical protein
VKSDCQVPFGISALKPTGDSGRLAGSGATAPDRVSIRWIAARDSLVRQWWVRCQPIVSALASRPASLSYLRIRGTSSIRPQPRRTPNRKPRWSTLVTATGEP